MPETPVRKTPVNTRLSDAEVAELYRRASAKGQTLSALVRMILLEWLESAQTD